MKHLGLDFRSLPVQIILSFAALVLLTAIAVGLPAIWLMHNQLERQAWAQVEQGCRAAQALYSAKQIELLNLATLTAQRPTLRELLAQGDPASTAVYLSTLQAGAGLDLVLVCDDRQQVFAWAGQIPSGTPCAVHTPVGFQTMVIDNQLQIWLLATHPLEAAETSARVITGIHLNDEFAARMHAETGLEHTLLVDNQPLVTSLADIRAATRPVQPDLNGQEQQSMFTSARGQPYYARNFPLSPPWQNNSLPGTLTAEVSLAVAGITAPQQGLVWTLVGSMVVVALVGSVLGIFLARRISRPLARLSEAAMALSQDHLDSPALEIEPYVREVALVAQALDNARIDLQRTLSELRREKEWADHLLEAIVEGIVTLDQQGRITFFSPGAERITGWRQNEALNRSCDEVFHVAETDEPFSQFIPPPGRRQKVTLELADGRHVTLAITGAQLMPPDTDDTRVALVLRDVSQAETMHRILGHFLANIAHEFRTPLSALAASVELLLDQAPDLSPDELQELLVSLHLGILGLQTLVDNLLESASIEAGRFQVKTRPANLGKIVAEAIRLMQPLLDKHGQWLVLDLPVDIPVVRADSRRTVQVLVNLISNASRYGPDEAEITIGASVDNGRVKITVADRGEGISPEHRGDLFRRFFSLGSGGDKSQYGVGLGLSVVKAVIEAEDGQVGVDDRPGGGSIFWFTLPVEQEG
ncbi:MAG: PAS domain S-box protein [Anaerolineae bacterium]|nr:PAS domain S-box protein [Anaerolineae bacterium]